MPYSKSLSFILIFLLIAQPCFASSLTGQTFSFASPEKASQPAKTIAILEFRNNTGIKELNSIPAILITNLSNISLLNIVERSEINRILEEHKRSISGVVDERTAKEAGKLLGADYMITGSFTKLGSDIRVDVKLIDTGSGSITGFSQTGCDENVIHRLSESLTKHLAQKEVSLRVETPKRLCPEPPEADKAWWWVWGIVAGVVVGAIIISACSGGGKGGDAGKGGSGGGC